jgi:hypothetical protein
LELASLSLSRSARPAASVALRQRLRRRALAQDDRLVRAGGPRDWAEPPQAPMAAPRRGARRQAYWPGARMLRSVGEHV